MRHGSLFSGIGGFDLAAQWMGWENVFQVEINSYCQDKLKDNFSGLEIYGDVRKFTGTKFRGAVDIVTGGFPCQPFSTAGSQKGSKDDRYLWPEMLRVIREIQPSYIVAENVYGIINQERGVVFETVCAQMEAEGYEVQPVIIPACAIGAQNRRDRVWFIGKFSDSSSLRQTGNQKLSQGQQHSQRREAQYFIDPLYSLSTTEYVRGESSFSGSADGLPGELDEVEAYGNAINPYVAFEIFKAIETVSL